MSKLSLLERLRNGINAKGIPTYDSPAVQKVLGKKNHLDLPAFEKYGYDSFNPSANDVENGFMFRLRDGGNANVHVGVDDGKWTFSNDAGESIGESIPQGDENSLVDAIYNSAVSSYPKTLRGVKNDIEDAYKGNVNRFMDWQAGKTDQEMLNEPWADDYLRGRMRKTMNERDKAWSNMDKYGVLPYGPYDWELSNKKMYHK